jgi:hypothetical protein
LKEQNFKLKYMEVSDKIRKVTYNTDYFDRSNFERRKGNSFHFNSGKIGKFIECEFEVPLRICMAKMVSHDNADLTFVI